ncbi:hypothetical protein [Chitinophaga nivalis]|uniref:3-oxo-5-alpha-steroid 4-dehydrogenase C-terminal domain-containing protein n=1 Tax=Chitinophaga nivalis TaxID=2991709 RepID=A0ABT3IN89_9BACT|nr:hypothetical protein [Chitinophaga nivalis]MCW3464860.1 hypothetical protein [Chitinophaga nivalis]MCW3485449.1 hypothetical protein [Chitinophaga nivalis]
MITYPSYTAYTLFITCWSAIGIGAGLYLLRQAAPYGRHTSSNWGPMVSNKIAWLLMETVVLISFAAWIPWSSFQWASISGFMIGLFLLHYLHRSFVYPFMIRTNGKKMPLVIMLSAILFNTVNGSLLGIWFAAFARYPDNWGTSLPFLLGVVCFGAGMWLNWWADYRLIRLRGKGDTGYKIPLGGGFHYVSSPNLLGEILEWGGYALLTWSLPALAFFIWTCANLVPRALSNHRWYRQKFPEYPAQRKVLIPFIW